MEKGEVYGRMYHPYTGEKLADILAPEAGEIIQIAVLTIRFGVTVEQLRETMFPYLTSAEGLRLAALGMEEDVALLSCCAG